MLLDEPAASLDAHSEQRVMQALNAASLQQTTLMVTHQLEGIADWDQIWVMENGHIVEQGDYAFSLLRRGHLPPCWLTVRRISDARPAALSCAV
jgi:ATP-binding cassette subfamily C protein CydD